jgi:hypothetical protein
VFFHPDPIEPVLSVVVGAVESGVMVNVPVLVFPALSVAVTVLAPLSVAPVVHEYVC